MRTWPGFEAPEEGLRDHVIRYLPRDYELFARLNPGDQYPQAWQHAMNMLAEKIARTAATGESRSAKALLNIERLRDAIVPPYDASKFPNKWRKMWRDQPARTLMAHLGKDSYSHIHYDSEQARTISVREAARLQSFPDGFVFCGTMNPAFRQIGNAVPPLMAKALAETMMIALRGKGEQDDHVSRERQQQFEVAIRAQPGIRPEARGSQRTSDSRTAHGDRGRPVCLHEQSGVVLSRGWQRVELRHLSSSSSCVF